jgi:hypothetical protein
LHHCFLLFLSVKSTSCVDVLCSFYPCEQTMIPCLKGDHGRRTGLSPCWKCQLAYYLSPAPLQGFEFEATLILNSALFNLVEAMPVLPGPCQLLNWPRMVRTQLRSCNAFYHYYSYLYDDYYNI